MSLIAYKKEDQLDKIIIRTNPIVGIIALTSFTETVSGVTSSDFFVSKTFRYSIDGIIFTNWVALTTPNITGLSFLSTDTIIIELVYQKNHLVNTLNATQVDFGTSDVPPNYVQNYFDKTIFSEFFQSDDLSLLNWYINVVEKIYEKTGLIPNFIERLNDNNSPEDFIEFWKAVAKFVGFYVIYAREFQSFNNVESLLREFLRERGITISSQDNLTELQHIMSTFYHQIFNRGTLHIVDSKYSIVDSNPVDGELLRLIYYKSQANNTNPTTQDDEFLFNHHRNEHFGWNVSNSSPLWRGLYLNQNLQKTTTSSVNTKVDHRLSYEISFFIQLQTTEKLSVYIDAFDVNSGILPLDSYTTGSNIATSLYKVKLQRSDKGIFVRVIIYPHLKPPNSNSKGPLNQGNHLILNNNISSLTPRVVVTNGSNVDTEVILDETTNQWSFKPLCTPYTHGLNQVYHWISIWVENNNIALTSSDLKQFIRQYLVPYNSTFELIDGLTDTVFNIDTEPNIPTVHLPVLAWRGVDPSCSYPTPTSGTVTYANLEQYDTATGLATGTYKTNVNTDPDFIAPTTNSAACIDQTIQIVHKSKLVFGWGTYLSGATCTSDTNKQLSYMYLGDGVVNTLNCVSTGVTTSATINTAYVPFVPWFGTGNKEWKQKDWELNSLTNFGGSSPKVIYCYGCLEIASCHYPPSGFSFQEEVCIPRMNVLALSANYHSIKVRVKWDGDSILLNESHVRLFEDVAGIWVPITSSIRIPPAVHGYLTPVYVDYTFTNSIRGQAKHYKCEHTHDYGVSSANVWVDFV